MPVPYHEWVIAAFSALGDWSALAGRRREWFSAFAWINVGVFYILSYFSVLSIETMHDYAHWNWIILASSYIFPYIVQLYQSRTGGKNELG